jgi:hypothetical protein
MLVRLWNFVEADLTNTDELRPYMDYWIRLTSGQMKDWHTPENRSKHTWRSDAGENRG